MGNFFSKIKEFFSKPDYEVNNCQGLKKCHQDMAEFYRSVNNENCPLHVKKIQNLVQCYNSYHPNEPLQIDATQNDLTELLTTEEDMRDLEKATEWLEAEIGNRSDAVDENDLEYLKTIREQSNSSINGGKSRKQRKSRRQRKTKRNRL
jgi:hypothetical protein